MKGTVEKVLSQNDLHVVYGDRYKLISLADKSTWRVPAAELTARLDRAEHTLNVELESWQLSEQQHAAPVDAVGTGGVLTIEGAEEKSSQGEAGVSATAGALVSMVEMLDAATVDCEFVLMQTPENLRALRLRGRAGFLRAVLVDAPAPDEDLLTVLTALRFTKGVLWKAGQLESDDAELAHMQVELEYKVQEMELSGHDTVVRRRAGILFDNGRSKAVDVHWVRRAATETTPMVTKKMSSVQPGKDYRCTANVGDRFVVFDSGDDQRIVHEITATMTYEATTGLRSYNCAILRDDPRAEHDALCQKFWETYGTCVCNELATNQHVSKIVRAVTPVEAHWFATAPAVPEGIPLARDFQPEPEPEPEPKSSCKSAAAGASASSDAYLAMVTSLDLPSQAASGSMQLARQRLAFAYSLRDAADALFLDLDVVQQVMNFVLLPNHWTPLMMATYRGLPDQVLSLVASGANLHAINIAGRSALDIARALKRQSVAAVLEAEML